MIGSTESPLPPAGVSELEPMRETGCKAEKASVGRIALATIIPPQTASDQAVDGGLTFPTDLGKQSANSGAAPSIVNPRVQTSKHYQCHNAFRGKPKESARCSRKQCEIFTRIA
jgi:hypothetical protein